MGSKAIQKQKKKSGVKTHAVQFQRQNNAPLPRQQFPQQNRVSHKNLFVVDQFTKNAKYRNKINLGKNFIKTYNKT